MARKRDPKAHPTKVSRQHCTLLPSFLNSPTAGKIASLTECEILPLQLSKHPPSNPSPIPPYSALMPETLFTTSLPHHYLTGPMLLPCKTVLDFKMVRVQFPGPNPVFIPALAPTPQASIQSRNCSLTRTSHLFSHTTLGLVLLCLHHLLQASMPHPPTPLQSMNHLGKLSIQWLTKLFQCFALS